MKLIFSSAIASILMTATAGQLAGLRASVQSPNLGRGLTGNTCGYDQDLSGDFDLFYGRDQVNVGSTSVTMTDSELIVKYMLKSDSGCTLDADDAVHVLLTSTEPTKNLNPGRFPCHADGNGGQSQTISCPLSDFDFSCCGPLQVYTHAALSCGSESETAFSGKAGCSNVGRWCNVAELEPSCECECDSEMDMCEKKKTCDTCGELLCPADTCAEKITCDCGDEVCPAGTPGATDCVSKVSCDCGDDVCPADVANCASKVTCDCGDEVCPADVANCVSKVTCDCGDDVCPADACEECPIPTPTCDDFGDCVALAPAGTCAKGCTNGVCEFTGACDKCCKYTSGNTSGGICAGGCGANNICIDSDTDAGKKCDDGPFVAICETGSDFCLCLVENGCNKQGCDDGIANCCQYKDDSDDFEKGFESMCS